MGYTREFITPDIELVCADEALNAGDVKQWAEERIAYAEERQGKPYGIVIDLRAVALVSVQMMMPLVGLVQQTRHAEGTIALVSRGQMIIGMAQALLRIAPKRQERLRNFDDAEQALAWVRGMLE
jgi:anti-anti-sigma regulatory factor